MKTFEVFTEKKRTENAILVSAFVDEVGKEETFFVPLSKLEIQDKKLLIDDDFWSSKLEEIKNPAPEKMITMISALYDKGEKSTKVAVKARLKSFDKVNEVWLFLPNSKVASMEDITEVEDEPQFKITLPEWVYNSALKSALEYQLTNFWNKDIEEDQKYTVEDFTIIEN
ncbi:hypothetical protein FNJ88_14050 (plasmid) [Chryseobacterium sp. SNU WT5]|uniref:hypothetical protein n=1 Tax=Chryseobacterium sp. SNU WT5 TaxID=2594269 RepID=UPI00117CE7DA|nr:hypothetical protein [Chryseobacterium sp. SNU WT5]QDP86724.1 hypothetical protein FNJ88_14050 [Chryseobacterium sp. SNU WT5]